MNPEEVRESDVDVLERAALSGRGVRVNSSSDYSQRSIKGGDLVPLLISSCCITPTKALTEIYQRRRLEASPIILCCTSPTSMQKSMRRRVSGEIYAAREFYICFSVGDTDRSHHWCLHSTRRRVHVLFCVCRIVVIV